MMCVGHYGIKSPICTNYELEKFKGFKVVIPHMLQKKNAPLKGLGRRGLKKKKFWKKVEEGKINDLGWWVNQQALEAP